ncbi:hypothetical protein PR202_gb04346 [Eleusine coracana subsp. coracana]|uniref:Methyltransferase n=1 Tax=Eleusine coracana subsp. coracana TaxID=191504 RepID=A0AAV5E546_ELECO|nr:hypothetical protein PR202_gb04346 [Eleusine coracana subsp. coracana]
MAISSALSFLSDRKRPIVVAVTFFVLISSLFLLFSPSPSALPFFFSPSSHLVSSSSPVAASPPAQTAIPVLADPSPAEIRTSLASDGVGNRTANPRRPDAAAAASDGAAIVSQSDHDTPTAAAEESGSGSSNDSSAGFPGKRDGVGQGAGGGVEERVEVPSWELCQVGKGVEAADYIPCLDNVKAIKALKSLRHMEHRERHCPTEPRPRCLVPLPPRYRRPVAWPHSRDMIWYNNVPHPKLVEYKKDQNWVRKSGNYFVFPGGGTQFKTGVTAYIHFIEQIMPNIQWGTHTRTVLDVGCGVASFGGYLLDRNVITMSLAPKDEHEAQIQFALERGIPAFLGVIGTQKLPFPDNSFDVIHCARCRVHWYTSLDSCLIPAVSSSGGENSWPISWPDRLNMRHSITSNNSSTQFSQEDIDSDTSSWKNLVSEVYLNEFALNWSSIRNVMDMNAGFGG